MYSLIHSKTLNLFFFTPGSLFSPNRWERGLQGHDFLFHVGNLTEMKTQTYRPTVQLNTFHERFFPSLTLRLFLLKKHLAAVLTYIYLKQITFHNFLHANLPEPLINPIRALLVNLPSSQRKRARRRILNLVQQMWHAHLTE